MFFCVTETGDMDSFTVDKSFYDISGGELRDLWDSDLDPTVSDVFREDVEPDEWGGGLLDVKPQVILHDRLISDAAIGSTPIKSEHSYSLTSDCDEPMPDSPHSRLDDMDSECYPCISMNRATSRIHESPPSPIEIKEEPMSDTESLDSCPLSPGSPSPIIFTEKQKTSSGQAHSILKQPAVFLATKDGVYTQQNRVMVPKLNIKIQPKSSGFSLPPTPPSSTTSDSEGNGNVSPDHVPVSLTRVHGRQSNSTRVFLSGTSRQPIQTPLISTQPKGSTGTLVLTEEEKRTLLAEGYPIPTRLPLTKAEEKSLKKIRRKIKNKISAQESRRKKKEYMDSLEKKVEVLTNENSDYKKRIENLEDNNATLLSQLQQLQALISKSGVVTTRISKSLNSTA